MTTHIVNQTSTIVNLLLAHKGCKQVRDEYKLNTHHITVLYGCFVYCHYIKSSFALYPLRAFIGYYPHYTLKKYVNRLLDIGMIALAGNQYTMTELGIKTVNQLSYSFTNSLYSFCSKYSIEL